QHRGAVNMVSVSPDGTRILTASADGWAIVWTLAGKPEIRLQAGPLGTSTWARFSPDGRRILTVREHGSAQIWSDRGQKIGGIGSRISLIWMLHGHVGSSDLTPLRGAAWSPDGAHVVTYSDDGELILSDGQGVRLQAISAHEGRIRGTRFSKDG